MPGWVETLSRMASSSALRLPLKRTCATTRVSSAARASTAAKRSVRTTSALRTAVLGNDPVDHAQAARHARGQVGIVRHHQHRHAALAVELDGEPVDLLGGVGVEVA